MKKTNLIFAILLILLGTLTAIAPFTFAHVCERGEKIMKCFWTARIELFLGIAIAVLAIIKLFSNNNLLQLGINAGIFLNSIAVILVPTVLIGVCGMNKMHCVAVTKPTLIVFGILILTLTLIQSILLWKKR